MLQIKHVKKQYSTGDLVQTALNDVSLNLRESELVAILGPSGSGKSTLLNVIGGLDQYDSGDLIIDGISTKKYSDRDWDSYRNHTVGFIFQSYNLIPHQTVLANVELALTISGVSRAGRRKRAIEALDAVGLGNQLHKKPNQMSGGQMQRVAIARALVNNPRIVLADEPTGALDSETSIQVMELLKEVAKDRLVVMVTHNPELAIQYADRIVRVKDGTLLDDSNPYEVDETALEKPEHRNMGKASMSFGSALALSFNNLKSKKGRTLLTAFAGSIGIIGIAIIMALSTGFQAYIDQVQEETLANNPLVLQSDTADLTSLLTPGAGAADMPQVSGEIVEEQPALSSVFEHIGSNDLGAFRDHLDAHYDEIGHTLNAVQYGYPIRPRIYTDDPQACRQVNPGCIFRDLTGDPIAAALLDADVFQEMLDNQALLDSQFDVLKGRWPESYDELVMILPAPGRLSDQVAYTLGIKDLDSLDRMIKQLMASEPIVVNDDPMHWSYDQLLDLSFRLVSVPELYQYNKDYNMMEDMSGDQRFLSDVIAKGETLHIVGIICPKEDTSVTLSPGIGYTSALTRHVIEKAAASDIVQKQLAHPEVDVFTGKRFDATEDISFSFEDLITIDEDALTSSFGVDLDTSSLTKLLEDHINDMAANLQVDTMEAESDFKRNLRDLCEDMLLYYAADTDNGSGVLQLYLTDVDTMVSSYLETPYAMGVMVQLQQNYNVPASTFYELYRPLMIGFLTDYIAQHMVTDGLFDPWEDQLPQLPEDAQPEAPEEVPEETPESVPEDTPEVTPENGFEVLPQEDPAELPQWNFEEQPPVTELPETEVPAEPVPDPIALFTEFSDTTPYFDMPEEQVTEYDITLEPGRIYAELYVDAIGSTVYEFVNSPVVSGVSSIVSKKMMQSTMVEELVDQAAGIGSQFSSMLGSSFHVDEAQLAQAFQFNMDETELQRLIDTMAGQNQERTAETNLKLLGYADPEHPGSISFYLKDFGSKEEFIAFLDAYNQSMSDADQEQKVIRYTDMSGAMMSSVRTIIDSVSYVLIAFVAISLLVSSIMIGIITYISVMERTKEIGVLRAMGASKRNISQVFNAETFIIGLLSGAIGIGLTLLLLIPGNHLIHNLMGSSDITATLPIASALILVFISMLLTLLGGLIPSKQASRKDPVIALRSE